MNTDNRDIIEIVLVGSIIAVLTVLGGVGIGRANLRHEAAKEGVGEYSVNPETGSVRFQWKHPSNNAPSTNDQFKTAIGISLQNSADIAYLIKLYDQVDRGMTDIFKRVEKIEKQRCKGFIEPIYSPGPHLTNTWPPQWMISTNIEIIQSGTNIYYTNMILGGSIAISNVMLYIQN